MCPERLKGAKAQRGRPKGEVGFLDIP